MVSEMKKTRKSIKQNEEERVLMLAVVPPPPRLAQAQACPNTVIPCLRLFFMGGVYNDGFCGSSCKEMWFVALCRL